MRKVRSLMTKLLSAPVEPMMVLPGCFLGKSFLPLLAKQLKASKD